MFYIVSPQKARLTVKTLTVNLAASMDAIICQNPALFTIELIPIPHYGPKCVIMSIDLLGGLGDIFFVSQKNIREK